MSSPLFLACIPCRPFLIKKDPKTCPLPMRSLVWRTHRHFSMVSLHQLSTCCADLRRPACDCTLADLNRPKTVPLSEGAALLIYPPCSSVLHLMPTKSLPCFPLMLPGEKPLYIPFVVLLLVVIIKQSIGSSE